MDTTSKKRKVLALFMILMLSLAALAGCGSESDDQQSGDSSGNSSSQTGQASSASLGSFTAETLDGSEFTQADLAEADVTVINFWATWCGPCTGEMPSLAEFEKTLPDNVNLVTCCLDGTDDPELASDILTEAGFEGTTIVNADGGLAAFSEAIQAIPTTIFVDGEGNLMGEPIVGADPDLAASYTDHINEALTSLGKQAI